MKTLKIGELTARIPVIQGGMGVGISLSGLAGSVAACGGVGVISTAQIGYRDPEFKKDPIGTNLRVIGEEIQKAREIAKGGILGVNIMVAYVANYPALCRLTDDDECGCLTFEIDRKRFSIRLTAPYFEERRSKAKETINALNRRGRRTQ